MAKLNFPRNYIRRTKPGEEFKLHSGGTSNVFYDVQALMENPIYAGYVLDKLLEEMPYGGHYIGIERGGADIVRRIPPERNAKVSFISKDGKLIGEKPKGGFVVVDDVATTGKTLEGTLAIIGTSPIKTIVVLDRRSEFDPDNTVPAVKSVFNLPFSHP
ncbi:MAG TPA: hypothetical protein VJ142_01020 [Candidatus Nanoarchaeia archaeon]|nr:hypothetical protein [Candidatus Nanoarchaeia archaeon]